MKMKVDDLELDTRLQPRNELNGDAIQQYASDMLAGDTFPAVDVFRVGGRYYVTSGWHRVLAAKKANIRDIEANVTNGSFDDAMWSACAANIEHDKSGSRRTNADKQKAVKMALQLPRYSNGQMNYAEIARHVGVDETTIRNWALRLGLVKTEQSGNSGHVKNITNPPPIDPTPEYYPPSHHEVGGWEKRLEEIRRREEVRQAELKQIEQEIKTESTAKFNKVNENIEWAAWSWNPVTGCLHDCPYCYARDIAERFYPEKFQPSYHPDRLTAPDNTNVPVNPRWLGDSGYRNVFTCSMADLFGKWVPEDWILSVLESIRRNPQWTFLLLTKFPVRMAEFEYPPNVWLGTTVDRQHAVHRAESAFTKIKASGFTGVCWLSCEPMLERLTFTTLNMFDWVVMGGSSKSTQTEEYRPPFDDIVHLYDQARAANCRIYQKTNLIPGMSDIQRIREYPQ